MKIGEPIDRDYVEKIRDCFYNLTSLCQKVSEETNFSPSYVFQILSGKKNITENNHIVLTTAERHIHRKAREAQSLLK